MSLIPCPYCNALNRVPTERLNDQPSCGRCKNKVLLSEPITLNPADFNQQVKGDLPLLLDIWAPWCGPCRGFAPVFAKAAQRYQGRVRFAKLDSDQSPELSARLNIRSIPTLILFKDGQELGRQSGAMNEGQLTSWLTQFGL